MQESGIVRRIDDLGRVVIPKELRKSLRIKEGDPLEIFASKEELIFRKYSPIESVKTLITTVAKGLEDLTEKVCIVTDTDKVLYSSSGYESEIGKTLSKELEKIMKDRKSVILSKKDGASTLPIVLGENFSIENQIIVPIISGGDCYGSLVLIDTKNPDGLSLKELNAVRLGSYVLAEQFSI